VCASEEIFIGDVNLLLSCENTCQVLWLLYPQLIETRCFVEPPSASRAKPQLVLLTAAYFSMSLSTGKRKRPKSSSEHRVAGTTFSDPFAQTARFTTTTISTGSGSVQSTAHNVNMGRNTVPKRVRAQPTAATEATRTNTNTSTKNQVMILKYAALATDPLTKLVRPSRPYYWNNLKSSSTRFLISFWTSRPTIVLASNACAATVNVYIAVWTAFSLPPNVRRASFPVMSKCRSIG